MNYALNGHSRKFPDRELFRPVSVELWLSDNNQQWGPVFSLNGTKTGSHTKCR